MKIKTNVKAGGNGNFPPGQFPSSGNHNETLLRAKGLKVKTHVKAGFTIKKTTD